ncbi:alpha/beta hydrolase [Pelagicoccus mobilis]|uniref:Alpha/beta hydrolase n=1 Tax=Pelagicoccus mobilis TaxID=415221 RepID=A0A934RZM1_9BACT|nr:alpha/beta hydrolase [Pelagicoccus mobilis]MBK1877227.1 alpha/beta hydrolase [Pelagicoccus mobilis]
MLPKSPLSKRAAILVLSFLFLGIAASYARDPDQKITFKTIGDTQLQLHVFEPANHQKSEKRPAIVFFFGGGWAKGGPSHFYSQSEYLANRGIVAICADYRTRNVHGTTPAECVKDGKSAMRWVRSNAAKLGIDPNRIIAGGGSAGGHIAAAIALISGFNEETDDLEVSPRPAALVLFNPVFDNGPEGFGHSVVEAYWQDFSPLHNITADAPPTLVLLGTDDQLIPVSTAELYRIKMKQKGARCDLILYEGQKHGFFNKGNAEHHYKTIIAMDRFLADLGYLQGEPTLSPPSQK